MSKKARVTYITLFLICIVVFMAACIVGTLTHLGYMRPEWSGVAFAWGAGAAGVFALLVLGLTV